MNNDDFLNMLDQINHQPTKSPRSMAAEERRKGQATATEVDVDVGGLTVH